MLKIVDNYFNGERKTLFYMETTLVNVVLNQFLMVKLFPFSYPVQIWKIKFFFKFGKNFTEVVNFLSDIKTIKLWDINFLKIQTFLHKIGIERYTFIGFKILTLKPQKIHPIP